MLKRVVNVIASMALLMGIAACELKSKPDLVATDITGADFAQSIDLVDHTGKRRTLDEFKGKAIALFFGYTHCPDVCPTTMTDMKQTMKLLGSRADELQVLFVTLDPERDTQEILAEFVPSFDKRFLGLRGTPEQIEATAKTFKIFSNKVNTDGKAGYTIDHSAGIYVFDKNGKIRLYVDYGEKPADIANDIKTIL
jgi:protein SCO1/2